MAILLLITPVTGATGCKDDGETVSNGDTNSDYNNGDTASEIEGGSDSDTTGDGESDSASARDPACGTLGLPCPCNEGEVCTEYDVCKPYTPSGIRCGLLGSVCGEDRPVCLNYREISGGTCMTEFEKQCICSEAGGIEAFSGCDE